MTQKQKRKRSIFAASAAVLTLAFMLALAALPGCEWIKKVEQSLPPIQLCVTYKGKTFCASKVDGKWRFEADLSPEEQAEIERHIEGR